MQNGGARVQLDGDADLAQPAGHCVLAAGRIVYLSDRILDTFGRSVERARIEIWQANTRGQYTHPWNHSQRS